MSQTHIGAALSLVALGGLVGAGMAIGSGIALGYQVAAQEEAAAAAAGKGGKPKAASVRELSRWSAGPSFAASALLSQR